MSTDRVILLSITLICSLICSSKVCGDLIPANWSSVAHNIKFYGGSFVNLGEMIMELDFKALIVSLIERHELFQFFVNFDF